MNGTQALYKTRFYSDCIGVFQGGGCRAASFAGAYAAAYEHGVRFIEVAGTSAGSIVAALIAAGGSPDYVLEQLQSLDFRQFLCKPSRSTFSQSSSMHALAQRVGSMIPGLKTIIQTARYGGLYSSEKVEEWVEARLRELTGKNGLVEFQDLTTPLHVVAGDLSAMRARVWSTVETPRRSVAHAVRASCSIPLFFQPVEEGSGLLVDGGILSNLPHFLFSNTSVAGHSGSRLLLFSLEASEYRGRAGDLKELLGQLATLIVDGGTQIQLAFAPDAARIVIPTGNIRATDFWQMDSRRIAELVQNGRFAA